MKNGVRERRSDIIVPLAVPAGTTAGNILSIGDMTVLAITNRHVAADYGTESMRTPDQGLQDGEASCEVIGVQRSVSLAVAGSATLGASVYLDGSGGYDLTSSGNARAGFALAASASAGAEIEVGLSR